MYKAEDGQGGNDSLQDITPPLTANEEDSSQSIESFQNFLKYPYAVVVDVKKDSDGLVRSVKARMSDGTIRNRDIRKIALIDAADD